MIIGFLYRGGLDQWSYAIAAEIAAQGSTLVRFTSEDVDFATRTIYGEFWKNGQWVRIRTRFPDAIRNYELRDIDKDLILETVPYCLGRHIRKDEQLELLSRTCGVSELIPATIEVDDSCDILATIRRWGAGILKPSRGRLGKGIIFLRTNGSNFDIEENGTLKTVPHEEITQFLKIFQATKSRPYVLQQFAAGTNSTGRYFNVRIIIQKSSDGDWHPCHVPLSLLAQPGSIIANREEGAVNICLRSLLAWRHGNHSAHILERLFDAAVRIARTLDDAVDGAADELALDMAVDNQGNPWLHEANWRGGFWLLEEDVGLYRLGGANMMRIARHHRAGCIAERSIATRIAATARPFPLRSPPGHRLDFDTNVTVGVHIARRSEDTAAITSEVICHEVPVLCLSSASSFRAAQRAVGEAIKAVVDQLPAITLPWIISRGGACIHDPKDPRTARAWVQDELLNPGFVDAQDLSYGTCISPAFIRRTIRDNRQDLGLDRLDTFILDGVENCLRYRTDYEERWKAAATELSDAIEQGEAREWGFAINDSCLIKKTAHLEGLLATTNNADSIPPSVLLIDLTQQAVDSDYLSSLFDLAAKLPIRCIFSLPSVLTTIQPWDMPHCCVPENLLATCIAMAKKGNVILCPAGNLGDLRKILATKAAASASRREASALNSEPAPDTFASLFSDKHNYTLPHRHRPPTSLKAMHALTHFAQFDSRQLFRFFVDGRFHKKYRGWTGYEVNEPGSVKGILNAYCLVLDNFDLSNGVTSRYIQNLHLACMSNVLTKNKKSTPGDLRYLDSGFNLFNGNSTLASLEEILEQRRGDGTRIFHTPGYQKTADEFTAIEILTVLKEHGRLRYRNWYPNLTTEQLSSLAEAQKLEDFYKIKHLIQREFALRVDRIVEKYNREIRSAATSFEKLTAISRIVRDLELLHPFPDGNCRTVVAVLMNHLLLYEGFLPAILRDPNIDAELSVKEFAEEIQKGIDNTKILIENPSAPLFEFSINDSTPEEITQFSELSRDVSLRLRPFIADETGPDEDNNSHDQSIYIYLTPNRLARATGGTWVNTDPQTLSRLRFLSAGVHSNGTQQQLLFCRSLLSWKSAGKAPADEIKILASTGVTAIVTDDHYLAQSSPIPALFVSDVDGALYAAATLARTAVNCKSVAILGISGKSTCKSWLTKTLQQQATTHATFDDEYKTPQVMVSLANLHSCDQIEIAEIWTGTRINVGRHRAKAVAPDICLFPQIDMQTTAKKESHHDFIKGLAACVDGLRAGGLCLVNSTCQSATDLITEIRERRQVAIQSFGVSPNDEGVLRKAEFDEQSQLWSVTAVIFNNTIEYHVHSTHEFAPLLSVGVLLAVENLGYDIYLAAKEL